jgi:hypothetical protein
MKYYTESLMKTVLNKETGELEDHRFIKDTVYRKDKKQGWIAMYKNGYDEIMMSLKSDLEKRLFIDIRDRFTKNKKVVAINQTSLAKKYDTTKSTVNRFIKKMKDIDFLYKTDDGYMMNPFMIIPYQADGLELQNEWKELHTNNKGKTNDKRRV